MINGSKTFDLHLNTVLEEDTDNIVIPINTVGLNSQMGGMGLALEYVHFMNTVRCITTENNKVYFLEGGAPRTITLDSRQHTAATLASELASKMTAALTGGGAVTVVYDSVTGHYTVTAGTLSIEFQSGLNDANHVIGITLADQVVIAGTTSLTLSGIADVSGPKLLVIECPELADYGASRKETNFLKQIPLKSPFGVTETYHSPVLTHKHVRMQSIQNITIRLRDEHGRPFKLMKNTPFYMNLILQPLQ